MLNSLHNTVDPAESLSENWIEHSVRDCGQNLEISVTDSGGGIPESVRDKMGQPFFTT